MKGNIRNMYMPLKDKMVELGSAIYEDVSTWDYEKIKDIADDIETIAYVMILLCDKELT